MAFDQPNHLTNNPPGTVVVDADKLEANFNYIIGLLNAGLPPSALSAAVLASLAQPGWIQEIAYDTPDTGWVLCDGHAESRAGQAALFAKIGTKYGAGDGSTTFNVPDRRGRVGVGKGTHTDVDTLGKSDGIAVGSRTPRHVHGLANHTHAIDHTHNWGLVSTGGPSAAGFYYSGSGPDVFEVPMFDHTHGIGLFPTSPQSTPNSGAPSPNTSDSGAPPYVVVNFQIKT